MKLMNEWNEQVEWKTGMKPEIKIKLLILFWLTAMNGAGIPVSNPEWELMKPERMIAAINAGIN